MRFPHTLKRPRCHYGPYTAGAKIGTHLVYIDARDVHPVVPCPPAHRNIGRSIVRRSGQSLRAGRGLGTNASNIVQNSPKQASRSRGSTSGPFRRSRAALILSRAKRQCGQEGRLLTLMRPLPWCGRCFGSPSRIRFGAIGTNRRITATNWEASNEVWRDVTPLCRCTAGGRHFDPRPD
jgi:hypothetical protein